MKQNNRVLCIIPARGGSKRLPGKNVKMISGKPLIAWTIESAARSKYIDTAIISTDDPVIAGVSKKYGAEVPFMRPRHLARDTSKIIDTLLYTLDWYEKKGIAFDCLLMLQPTSPLRTVDDVDQAIEYFFKNKKARAVVSVCEETHHPDWSNTLPRNLSMAGFLKKSVLNKNKQELNKYYRLNGAFYIARCDYLRESNGFFGDKTFA